MIQLGDFLQDRCVRRSPKTCAFVTRSQKWKHNVSKRTHTVQFNVMRSVINYVRFFYSDQVTYAVSSVKQNTTSLHISPTNCNQVLSMTEKIKFIQCLLVFVQALDGQNGPLRESEASHCWKTFSLM